MKNESDIAVVSGGDIVALTGGDLSKLIDPLTREIYLFDSYVAGTTHIEDRTVFDELGEKTKLTMQREKNKYDSNAIILSAPSGKKVGYVPEQDNPIFARLMDAGKVLIAYTKEIKKVSEKYIKINIGIYLLDF